MDIFVIVKQLVQLFLMLFLGYFLCKAGIFDRHTNQKMTKLCLYVTTPCLILTSVLQRVEPEIYAPCYVFASRCVKSHYSALVVEFLCFEQWSLRVDPQMLLFMTGCACLIMHVFSLRFFVLRSLHAHHPLCLYPSEYFCISFFDVAQVSPESVLVHLLIRLHIPESACVW